MCSIFCDGYGVQAYVNADQAMDALLTEETVGDSIARRNRTVTWRTE
jgi:hypothetical protein